MENNFITRKNLRISKYNYSNIGCYFITICTQDRKNILSKIYYKKETLVHELSDFGIITEKYIKSINKTYNEIKINYYIVMPNHIHFICEIIEKHKNTISRTNEKLPFLISTIKRLINKECKEKIWQRNYYEHVIRNEKEYKKIVKYIEDNPYKWEKDIYFSL